jgi:predicted RNase H-like HicB family nuclease
MEYVVVVHKAEEGGYWAEVPALPGCASQGETFEETLANVSEAISLYVEVKAARGEAVAHDEEVFIGKVIVPPAAGSVAKRSRRAPKRRTAAAA